jgi:hypothetical protein
LHLAFERKFGPILLIKEVGGRAIEDKKKQRKKKRKTMEKKKTTKMYNDLQSPMCCDVK